MKNPRHVNETDAILLDYNDGGSIYTESSGPTMHLWNQAIKGVFGEVAPYEPKNDMNARQRIGEKRKAAYREYSDPLFFKWQAGEVSKEDWESSREFVRSKFPYPEEV